MSANAFIDELENRALNPGIDLKRLSAEQQFERIMDKVSNSAEAVVSPKDLLDRLKNSKRTGRPLKIKFGIDPTGPDIHIGHAIPLINLRLFQRMGHKVVLVIGDFTGMIGDPSGRLDGRPALTEEEVKANMATYEQQASRVIDLTDPSIERHYNTEWMDNLTVGKWVNILKQIPANSLLQREDFRKRIAAGQGLSMAEIEYAIYMGFDSVVLNPDAELGGADQYLNMHMCRQMMENAGQKPEIIISYNLLAGTSGECDEQGRYVKMSKSKGNYIPVTASPEGMYGKVMSVPDEIMWLWFRELTELSSYNIEQLRSYVQNGAVHPKEAKQFLARVIVGTFNFFDSGKIEEAERAFNSKFGKEAILIPEDTETVQIAPGVLLIDSLVQVTQKSKNEIRRMVQQEGIRILKGEDYVPIDQNDLGRKLESFEGNVIRMGKRNYYRFKK